MENKIIKGTSFGLIAGLTWGLDTVFSGLALTLFPFVTLKTAAIVAPFVGVFFHDSLSGIWTFIYILITGKFKKFIKVIVSKSARTAVLIGILAGPVAMTGYYGAVNYMGASNAATFTAIYPIVGALFSVIFLKEKLNYKAWTGLVLTIVGVIVLGYGKNSHPITTVGILFGIMAILGWGGETVLCAFGFEADKNLEAEYILQIRQIISGGSYLLIFLPLLGAYPIVRDVIGSNTIFIFLLAALFGTISIIFYYKTIDNIGPTKAMGLNSTCSIWAMVFALVIQGKSITISMVIAAIIVILGTMLMVSQPRVRRI